MHQYTPQEILGFATAILDVFGVRVMISVFLFIILAFYVFDRFFRHKD